MTMTRRWLDWSGPFQEVGGSSQEGTDKTDKNPVLAVLSAPAEPMVPRYSDSASIPATSAENEPLVGHGKRRVHDPIQDEALGEIADLFVGAYQRYIRIRRIPANHPLGDDDPELALSFPQSVHG